MKNKTYLGDGVYVAVDDYGDLVLTTEDGISIQNRIVLDAPASGAEPTAGDVWGDDKNSK